MKSHAASRSSVEIVSVSDLAGRDPSARGEPVKDAKPTVESSSSSGTVSCNLPVLPSSEGQLLHPVHQLFLIVVTLPFGLGDDVHLAFSLDCNCCLTHRDNQNEGAQLQTTHELE